MKYWLMSRGKAFTRKAAYHQRALGTNLEVKDREEK
jgi:hypothetical protein